MEAALRGGFFFVFGWHWFQQGKLVTGPAAARVVEGLPRSYVWGEIGANRSGQSKGPT